MSVRVARCAKFAPYVVTALVVLAAILDQTPVRKPRYAGACVGFVGGGQSVGGISIDATGTLKNADLGALDELRKVRARALAALVQ